MDNDDRNTNDAPSDKKEKKYIYEPKEQVSTGWNIAFCIVAAVIARFVRPKRMRISTHRRITTTSNDGVL